VTSIVQAFSTVVTMAMTFIPRWWHAVIRSDPGFPNPILNTGTRSSRTTWRFSGVKSGGGAGRTQVAGSPKALRMGFKAACTTWSVASGTAAAGAGGRRSWESKRLTPKAGLPRPGSHGSLAELIRRQQGGGENPRAPALETSVARVGPATPPTPDWRMG
jgi:hypothetical protein